MKFDGAGGERGGQVRTVLYALGAAAAYALGCGSKESAVVLPAVLAAQWFLFAGTALSPSRSRKEGIIAFAPVLAVLLSYVVLRANVLGGMMPARQFLGEAGAAEVAVFGSRRD